MAKYYYETIKVDVQGTGYYTFGSISSINTYGYIYQNHFNPFNPKENLLAENGTRCSQYDMKFTVLLHVNTTYILVMTTLSSNKQGNFSVLVTGPNNITFNHTSEYF